MPSTIEQLFADQLLSDRQLGQNNQFLGATGFCGAKGGSNLFIGIANERAVKGMDHQDPEPLFKSYDLEKQ